MNGTKQPINQPKQKVTRIPQVNFSISKLGRYETLTVKLPGALIKNKKREVCVYKNLAALITIFIPASFYRPQIYCFG